MEMIVIGFLTSVAVFIVMVKINLRFFCRYNWQSDLGVTALLAFLFYGSFAGMVTAAVAGLFLSVFLTVTRRVIGEAY